MSSIFYFKYQLVIDFLKFKHFMCKLEFFTGICLYIHMVHDAPQVIPPFKQLSNLRSMFSNLHLFYQFI